MPKKSLIPDLVSSSFFNELLAGPGERKVHLKTDGLLDVNAFFKSAPTCVLMMLDVRPLPQLC